MSTIHIFGASGLIGSSLKRLCKNNGIPHITYASSKKEDIDYALDIRNESNFNKLDNISSNDVVVNLAAIANPSLVFKNPKLSEDINVKGNKNILNWTKKNNAKFVFMSSVEVFDGENNSYKENDVTNPINLYGKQKEISEKYIINDYIDNSIIARTSWNISDNGIGRCLVDVTISSLLKKNAKMATDNVFTISSANETAENLLKIIYKNITGIIHIASPSPITRYEIADLIKRNINIQKLDFSPCKFRDLEFGEPRSRINVLDTALSVKNANCEYSDPRSIILKKIIKLNCEKFNN